MKSFYINYYVEPSKILWFQYSINQTSIINFYILYCEIITKRSQKFQPSRELKNRLCFCSVEYHTYNCLASTGPQGIFKWWVWRIRVHVQTLQMEKFIVAFLLKVQENIIFQGVSFRYFTLIILLCAFQAHLVKGNTKRNWTK